MKLLIVEDDSFFASCIAEYLSDNGIDSVTAKSTHEALGFCLDEYGGAIIDVMLPNDSEISGITPEEARGGYLAGVALARRFRRLKGNFPVVLISSDISGGEARNWAKKHNCPFVFKYDDRSRLLSALADLGLVNHVACPKAFIVHGHDENMLFQLKDYLQNILKWPEPIVLREQPNCGKTIIEKFEEYASSVDWVFVLMSPDDKAINQNSDNVRRARQNVIFEFGFFYGLIGRHEGRVIVLKKGEIDMPSDIQGVIWIDVETDILSCGELIRKEVAC